MKGMDIFCASQAATAIRLSSMDEASSSSSSSTAHLGGTSRAIDRHNPIIHDARRAGKSLPLVVCGSQTPPMAPIPYKLIHHKGRKTASSSSASSKAKNDKAKKSDKKKKSATDELIGRECDAVRKSGVKVGDFISPPGSTRYLLGESGLSDFEPGLGLVHVDNLTKGHTVKPDDSSGSTSKSPFSCSRSPDQVVVLRVSLHCKGCEGKVRKHISRMQGVTSFDIDFAAKKVTVVGDVTPLGVLASISKVKTAQLWSPVTKKSKGPMT
ncbi:Protein SODIUM POTASSIUM ROOT DEFECTIVE 2 like [Actinidia chinensis var. chinensis]|uniref:Protein SODIUM POTASSIUM ROOT DEFECTIVE 2 like n=1 Tax=Actinidia chinensis var. chinensis TaxID=1590841 RepID=A0A2R6PWW1_ACTCC|nr:Protein SODIUM POTASSIUM ROOT DEFECTIVE 2 like [Actinidia chinensis var. chinensis]